jgi:MoaA/NifB/PqqE/SkfB family radical SAM enzyme
MKKQIIEIKKIQDEFCVYWILTDFCNQACSYCTPNLYEGKFHKLDAVTKEMIDIFISKLIDITKTKNTKLKVVISGGEPTVHDHLPEIIARLMPYGEVRIMTNGTRNVSWWRSLPVLPTGVVISLHPEYYDKKKIGINDVSAFLIDNNVDIFYNLMCNPAQWDIVTTIIDDIDDQFKKFLIAKVIQDHSLFDRPMYPYTTEQLDFIKTYTTYTGVPESIVILSDGTSLNLSPNKLMAHKLHYLEGWKCSAGVSAIRVDPNGKVSAGICKATLLGSMTDFQLFDEYISCPRPSCVCPGDIVLNKYDPNYRLSNE